MYGLTNTWNTYKDFGNGIGKFHGSVGKRRSNCTSISGSVNYADQYRYYDEWNPGREIL